MYTISLVPVLMFAMNYGNALPLFLIRRQSEYHRQASFSNLSENGLTTGKNNKYSHKKSIHRLCLTNYFENDVQYYVLQTMYSA